MSKIRFFNTTYPSNKFNIKNIFHRDQQGLDKLIVHHLTHGRRNVDHREYTFQFLNYHLAGTVTPKIFITHVENLLENNYEYLKDTPGTNNGVRLAIEEWLYNQARIRQMVKTSSNDDSLFEELFNNNKHIKPLLKQLQLKGFTNDNSVQWNAGPTKLVALYHTLKAHSIIKNENDAKCGKIFSNYFGTPISPSTGRKKTYSPSITQPFEEIAVQINQIK